MYFISALGSSRSHGRARPPNVCMRTCACARASVRAPFCHLHLHVSFWWCVRLLKTGIWWTKCCIRTCWTNTYAALYLPISCKSIKPDGGLRRSAARRSCFDASASSVWQTCPSHLYRDWIEGEYFIPLLNIGSAYKQLPCFSKLAGVFFYGFATLHLESRDGGWQIPPLALAECVCVCCTKLALAECAGLV